MDLPGHVHMALTILASLMVNGDAELVVFHRRSSFVATDVIFQIMDVIVIGFVATARLLDKAIPETYTEQF